MTSFAKLLLEIIIKNPRKMGQIRALSKNKTHNYAMRYF